MATRGWLDTSGVAATRLIAEARAWGVPRVIYTDIARDGTLTVPNYAALREVVAVGLPVIASGGVAAADHLVALRALGAEGAIVGKALYDGALTLEAALAALRDQEPAAC